MTKRQLNRILEECSERDQFSCNAIGNNVGWSTADRYSELMSPSDATKLAWLHEHYKCSNEPTTKDAKNHRLLSVLFFYEATKEES